ncbi:hypothetical protein EVAR_64486_1 [Eumeta japonica]|uniref:Uncharacterized protein n=1 Tax=Eumeta variegata TaxID=151549 RepID=A0A4C1ZV52_EUMVA|nr:hypothetical protein EVAR_64486_1 [Eumeta japonica]
MSRRKSRVSVAEKSNTLLKSLSAIPLSRSTFTLSFALEILGQNEGASTVKEIIEGRVELGTCLQGYKIHYRLSPTNVYDLDVFAWSDVAKDNTVPSGSKAAWLNSEPSPLTMVL